MQQCYSANFGIGHGIPFRHRGHPFPQFAQQASLEDIRPSTFMIADGFGQLIFSPLPTLNYPFDFDWDEDGIADTNHGAMTGSHAFYNGVWLRRHVRGGETGFNAVLADGSARRVTMRAWLSNEGEIWGSVE